MNYKQFRDNIKEQKLKHHDKVRVMLHKVDGGQGYIIGIINLKANPCELCISYDHNNIGKIDTDIVYGINIDRVVSIELIKD